MNPLEQWLKTRPAVIQAAARKWPIGTTIDHAGARLYLVGWGEPTDGSDAVTLIMSPIDPAEDYESAIAQAVRVCADHIEPAALRRVGPIIQ